MEHKTEQQKKDQANKGSCSTGSMPKTSGSCDSEAKKTEKTGCCGSGSDKGKKGSCS